MKLQVNPPIWMIVVGILVLAVWVLLRGGGPMSEAAIKEQLERSDALFKEGRFAEADAGYAKVLKADPKHFKALIRRGYIALLSNRLEEAEGLLKQAAQLDPTNPSSKALLAEVFYRRDEFAQAGPLLRELGREAAAKKLESFQGLTPYEVEGPEETRLKFVMTDPLPVVQVRVNGSEPVNFFIDTGGAELVIDTQFAKETGVIEFGSEPVTPELQLGHGRVDVLVLGEWMIENVPVHILNTRQFSEIFEGTCIDGVIGTVLLYHFLATLDYPEGQLILRRRTPAALEAFERDAKAHKAIVVPFWLAGDHFIVAWGTVNKSRPMLFLVDTGLAGKAFTAPESTLKEAGIQPDESKASEGLTIFGKERAVPFTIAELTLGKAVEHDLEGVANSFTYRASLRFRIGGLISHQFFRRYALTLDFVGMRLFLEREAGGAYMSAEQLIDRWAQALGGLEKLKQIENVYTLSVIETGGLSGTVEEWQTVQGQHKQRLDLGGVYKILTVFDREKGWILDQNGKVQALAGTELESEVTAAYLGSFSHFIMGRMPGRADYLGEDESHHILRLLPDGGRPVTVYLSKETGLPVKQEHPEAERTRTVYLSDWRDVDGIKIPFRMRQTTGDPKYDVLVTIQEVRFNVPLDETAFQKPQDVAPDFRFVSRQRALGIPFELTSNHIYLQVRVNNSEPLWFILDTGASLSVIDVERAKALGLELAGKLEGRGAGERSVDVAFVKGASFSLPGVELFDQTIAALSLDSLEPYEGRAIDGILGYDFISRFVVEIDYAKKIINLYDAHSFKYDDNGESIPITLEESVPHVRAKIVLPGRNPIEGKFTVDIGSRGALSLAKPFTEANRLLESVPKTIQAPFGAGVGGETKQLIGRVKSLQLGRFIIENSVAGFSQDVKGALASPDYAGLIGGEILRRFKVIFDYSHQQMILEPNAQLSEPYEYDMSGVYLIAEGPDFKVFKAHRVIENSPASEAGLREGDVITAVDGRPATEFTLEQMRQMFKQEGMEYLLSIKRGEKLLQIIIKLRRLI